MSEINKPEVGSISWVDLTIENAENIKEFYSSVVGWDPDPVSMGDYNDFNMNTPEDGKTIAGICHARGGNKELPPQWLIYITVEDVNQSAKKCEELGGKILSGPKSMLGYGSVCVIEDPAGAVAALFEPATK